jgi:hypothetical protein
MHEYNTLICEITEFSHTQSNRSVDFTHHSNSERGRLISIPFHTSQEKCVYKARNKGNQWLEDVLDQLAGEDSEKDDATQLISYYLCMHHQDAFLAAASSLGLPIVQKMQPHVAHTMWTAANININQQLIVR